MRAARRLHGGGARRPDLPKLDAWLARHRSAMVRSVHTVEAFAAAGAGLPDGLAGLSNPPPLVHFNAAGQRVIAEVARAEVAALRPLALRGRDSS